MDTPANSHRQQEIDRKVVEQAAEWFTLFEQSGAAVERDAFAEWLMRSPVHVQAFLKVTATERVLEGLQSEQWPETGLDGVVRNRNVVELKPAIVLGPHRQRRGRKWVVGLAATVAALGVFVWQLAPIVDGRLSYTTATGEQRSVELADGSVAHMNAQSRLEVRFTSRERELRLLAGEVLFRVHNDPARPFRVRAGEVVVQALGTQFNVDRRNERTTVSVVEGVVRVSVHPDSLVVAEPAAPGTVESNEVLMAGQTANIVADGRISRNDAVDVTQVTAWRQRRLVFEEDTLEDIAAEFNRYNRTPQIKIEGDAVRERRYAAVFDADDPESLLLFLRRDPGIVLEVRGQSLIVRQRQ